MYRFSGREKLLSRIGSAVLGFLLFFMPAAQALPTGWEVVSGNVSFESQGTTLIITSSSNQAIINYQSFNIGAGETVNFIMPGDYASILNRILGGGPTSIAGNLNSNGQVLLVNPGGINFAQTANVNVAGLLASSTLTNQQYLSNDLIPNPAMMMTNGGINNAGNLLATKFIVLDGSSIVNEGTIAVAGGIENGRIVATAQNDIVNTGTINGNGADIEISGNNIIQSGTLISEGSSGNNGGFINVQAMGDTHLTDGSFTSARGRGQNSNSGDVIIMSQGDTYFDNGAILDVSGGDVSGDGGFSEVSARNIVFFNGSAYGGATDGTAGQILIDPTVIRIRNAGAPGGTASVPHATANNNSCVGGESCFLNTSFNGFANVTLEATNDIFVESAWSLGGVTAGNNLILRAGDDIFIQGALSTAGGNITLAGNYAVPTPSGAGDVSITNTGSINTNGGNLTISGTGAYFNNGSSISTGAGTMTVNTGYIDVSGNLGTSNVVLNSTWDMDLTVTANINSVNSLTTNAARRVTIYSPLTLTAANASRYTFNPDSDADDDGHLRMRGAFTLSGTDYTLQTPTFEMVEFSDVATISTGANTLTVNAPYISMDADLTTSRVILNSTDNIDMGVNADINNVNLLTVNADNRIYMYSPWTITAGNASRYTLIGDADSDGNGYLRFENAMTLSGTNYNVSRPGETVIFGSASSVNTGANTLTVDAGWVGMNADLGTSRVVLTGDNGVDISVDADISNVNLLTVNSNEYIAQYAPLTLTAVNQARYNFNPDADGDRDATMYWGGPLTLSGTNYTISHPYVGVEFTTSFSLNSGANTLTAEGNYVSMDGNVTSDNIVLNGLMYQVVDNTDPMNPYTYDVGGDVYLGENAILNNVGSLIANADDRLWLQSDVTFTPANIGNFTFNTDADTSGSGALFVGGDIALSGTNYTFTANSVYLTDPGTINTGANTLTVNGGYVEVDNNLTTSNVVLNSTYDVRFGWNADISNATSLDANAENGIHFSIPFALTPGNVAEYDFLPATNGAARYDFNPDSNLDGDGNLAFEHDFSITGLNYTLNVPTINVYLYNGLISTGANTLTVNAENIYANNDFGTSNIILDVPGNITLDTNTNIQDVSSLITRADSSIDMYADLTLTPGNVANYTFNPDEDNNGGWFTLGGNFALSGLNYTFSDPDVIYTLDNGTINTGANTLTVDGAHVNVDNSDFMTSNVVLNADYTINMYQNANIQNVNNLIVNADEELWLYSPLTLTPGNVSHYDFNIDTDNDTWGELHLGGDFALSGLNYTLNYPGYGVYFENGGTVSTGANTLTVNGSYIEVNSDFTNSNTILNSTDDIVFMPDANLDSLDTLTANANDAIDIYSTINTIGDLVINPNADNVGTGDFILRSGATLASGGAFLSAEGVNVILEAGSTTSINTTNFTFRADNNFIASGTIDSATNGSLNIIANNFDLNSTINLGTGSLNISPFTNTRNMQLIGGATGVAESGTQVDIAQGELDLITAGSVQIGNTTTTGVLTVGNSNFTNTTGNVTLSTTGAIVAGDVTPNITLAANRTLTITGGNNVGSGQVGAPGALSFLETSIDFLDLRSTGPVYIDDLSANGLTITNAISNGDMLLNSTGNMTVQNIVNNHAVSGTVLVSRDGNIIGKGTAVADITSAGTGAISVTAGNTAGDTTSWVSGLNVSTGGNLTARAYGKNAASNDSLVLRGNVTGNLLAENGTIGNTTGDILLGDSIANLNVTGTTRFRSATEVIGLGNFTGNITLSNGGRVKLTHTGTNDFRIDAITANGTVGFGGGSDPVIWLFAPDASIIGVNTITTDLNTLASANGNILIQAGDNGATDTTDSISNLFIRANGNVRMFAAGDTNGDNTGTSISTYLVSAIAGYVTAAGEDWTFTDGAVNIAVTNSNLNPTRIQANGNVTMTANNGAIIQNNTLASNEKSIFSYGDIALTAQGSATSYVDVGLRAYNSTSDLTVRTQGSSDGTVNGMAVDLNGYVGGNVIVRDHTGAGTANGTVRLGSTLGGSVTNVNDTYLLFDGMGSVDVQTDGDIIFNGSLNQGGAGNINMTGRTITGDVDLGTLNLGPTGQLNATGAGGTGINITNHSGAIIATGANAIQAATSNVILQAGTPTSHRASSWIDANINVGVGQAITLTAWGKDTSTGNAINVTGSGPAVPTINNYNTTGGTCTYLGSPC